MAFVGVVLNEKMIINIFNLCEVAIEWCNARNTKLLLDTTTCFLITPQQPRQPLQNTILFRI